MSGHTPGEWTAREGTTTGAEVVAKKPRGGDYVVARCAGKDRVANADLVAAAPALLAIAKTILDRGYVSQSIEEERADHLALVAAIARAEDSHV